MEEINSILGEPEARISLGRLRQPGWLEWNMGGRSGENEVREVARGQVTQDSINQGKDVGFELKDGEQLEAFEQHNDTNSCLS